MKEAFYFPHFCNARNDIKIKRMMKQLGNEAYAIYFMLLEVLREQPGMKYPLHDIDLLEDELRTSKEKITLVIQRYDLFEIDENNFFSPRLIEYMQPYLEKRQRALNAINKRWGTDTNVNTNVDTKRVEQSRVEQSREINADAPLSFDFVSFLSYFNQNRGQMPEIANITDRRRQLIEALLTVHSKKHIFTVLNKAKESRFLQGQNERGWKATLDWLIIIENFEKVLAGNYDNKKNTYQ